jgi:glycine/D-amino acid oxidase-like deaminating enzyme
MGVETDQGFIPGGAAIVAAGPWSPALLQKLGVNLPFHIARIKIGLFRRPDDFPAHRVWGDLETQVYLRPETGGLTLVGSIHPKESEDRVEDPDNFNTRAEIEVMADFGDRASHRYPALSRSHLSSSYASLYDITPDWHPILDAVPGVDGLFLCAGSSGHGFKLAPAVGEMMAELVLQGRTEEDSVSLFAFDRFQRGRPVQGKYEYSIIG